MDLFERIESTRFVGVEFLTWLWTRVARDDGLFDIAGEKLELSFEKHMTFETNLAESERTRLSGGAPSESPEARQALRCGKVVTQAQLRIHRDAREWALTLNGRSLALAGLKIPAVLGREDDDRFYERMDLIEEAESMVAAIFAEFLKLRLDAEAWDAELGVMREWLQAADA